MLVFLESVRNLSIDEVEALFPREVFYHIDKIFVYKMTHTIKNFWIYGSTRTGKSRWTHNQERDDEIYWKSQINGEKTSNLDSIKLS